ncbi:MAG: hypothetical protein AUF67_06440 [Acidobacteria bacterium 13_1_20CM_58_21]|nr:MAG: hypothetical protein AUF67_06440 [Acidobacteria bacterium 13_1_20CM_58_21]
MFANLDDSERRHGDANAARELKHYEFVLRNGGKPGRGKLHNPGAAHAVGRNAQAAGSFHDGGKLQLYAGQRKAHRGTVIMIAAGGGVMGPAILPSGSKLEKNGGTRKETGQKAVTSPPVLLLKVRLSVGRCGSAM